MILFSNDSTATKLDINVTWLLLLKTHICDVIDLLHISDFDAKIIHFTQVISLLDRQKHLFSNNLFNFYFIIFFFTS
jgi:hypothetical protein